MPEAILSLDVGTTVAKAVLFALDGKEIAASEAAYPLQVSRAGWVEQDPEEVWQAVITVLRAIAGQLEGDTAIAAIALSTQGGSLVTAGEDGCPTYPIITWMDTRASALVQQWQVDGTAQRVRRISGWSLDPGLPLPMIGWLRQNLPEVFANTKRFLSINDFLAYRLTGNLVMNPSMAGEMLLANIASGDWSDELCAIVGITPKQLSPIQPSEAVIGRITPEVSRLTGLASGVAVMNGGQDHACEALAVGLTSQGKVLLACGTAWVINAVVETPAIDPIPGNMNLNFHVLPDRWVVSQFLGGLGGCVEWWVNQCWQNPDPRSPFTRAEIYACFNRALLQTHAGCDGLLFLPLTGNRQLKTATQHGGFFGLRLSHTRADMSRAVLEGAAYELRWALERLRQSDIFVEQLWMIGGATRNPVWPGIIADVSGIPVSLTQYTHGPALGAAILAGVGLGIFDSVEASRSAFKIEATHVLPDEKRTKIYNEYFKGYQRVSQALACVKGS